MDWGVVFSVILAWSPFYVKMAYLLLYLLYVKLPFFSFVWYHSFELLYNVDIFLDIWIEESSHNIHLFQLEIEECSNSEQRVILHIQSETWIQVSVSSFYLNRKVIPVWLLWCFLGLSGRRFLSYWFLWKFGIDHLPAMQRSKLQWPYMVLKLNKKIIKFASNCK